MAHAAMNTPAYTSPGTEVGAEMHMMKPTAMMHRQTTMKGLRRPTRSDAQATITANMAAVM